MAYSVTSMYHPAVLPPTQGLGLGIMQAGGAISNAFGRIADWKRDDRVREDTQEHESGLAQQKFDLESSLVDKRMQRDIDLFGMEQDARKQERQIAAAMAEEQVRAANAGMAAFLANSGTIDQATLAAAAQLKPKEADPFLRALMGQHGMQLKAQMEAEERQQRSKEARETFTYTDPLTGKPHEGHFMTGSGMALPRASSDGLTLQDAVQLGLVPSEANVGGVKFATPRASSTPPPIRTVVDEEGVRQTVVWDQQDQQWVPWRPPMAAPSDAALTIGAGNAIGTTLQNRARNK